MKDEMEEFCSQVFRQLGLVEGVAQFVASKIENRGNRRLFLEDCRRFLQVRVAVRPFVAKK